MEKCCRNCHYFEYGRCLKMEKIFNVVFEGKTTVDLSNDECEDVEKEVCFSENDVDTIDYRINNPESFYCKEWE